MNPHKIPPGFSFYTYNQSRAEQIAQDVGGRVDRYSLGLPVERENLPFAVYNGQGALLVNWHAMSVHPKHT